MSGEALFRPIRRKRRKYALPSEAQFFIERYDDGQYVEPFEFDVDETKYVEVLDG